jgi:hypothetical protein
MMKRCAVTGCVSWGIAYILTFSQLLAQAPAEKLPPLNVEKNKLTFDPQTVAIGEHGAVHTGCSGVVLKITAREKGLCHFTYTTDGCGGVFAYYRGEVSVTAGPVTVEVFNGGIRNSFAEKNLTLIRSTGPPGSGSRP